MGKNSLILVSGPEKPEPKRRTEGEKAERIKGKKEVSLNRGGRREGQTRKSGKADPRI